jgi:hypothetical protein
LYEHQTITGPATATILQQPKHGVLRLVTEADGNRFGEGQFVAANQLYVYLPDPNYVGKDSGTIQVDFGNGLKVNVKYYFQAMTGGVAEDWAGYCSKTGTQWKINSSLDTNGTSAVTSVEYQTPATLAAEATSSNVAALASWINTTDLSGNAAGITVNVANLGGAAVGQDSGTSITLDATAAGNGWYINTNPADNSQFLPTSNPNVWIAAPGSAAAGKMDMLSVLLHEYGHALGLDHSANPNDFMAPNLQPGERRLPSAAELAMMSQLAAQLNLGSTATAVASSTAPAPTSPAAPVLPIGTALSALLIGRLRRTDYGSLSPVITSAQIPAPQFELAINSTLTNNNFAGGTTDWNVQGNVTTNTTGTAMLTNSTSADAQLAQAFNITSQDRYIEFTVVNGLQKGNGPADAFEVALDNAVTGTALVGTDGLSNSDGLLNIQADGTTHAASSVQTIVNADGTTTYVIDLQSALSSGAITGMPAALSFDLIGFGNSQSQVSIKDIMLLQTPLAVNENVTTKEDAAVNISPLAGNQIVAGTTPQLNITQNPANGVLTQNADGTFSYVPNTHFFGTDSFQYSYTLSGGTSNVATVSIVVNEVAYPPIGSNSIAAATAGKPYTFNPLAGAADINGNVMTAVLDTAPANGTVTQNADGTWTYTPSASYVGSDTLVYHIADGQAVSTPITASFTVQPAHHAPVANSSVVMLQENGSLLINLANYGVDADGNPMTGSVTAQPVNGTLTQNADGTYTYTPAAGYYGHDSLSFVLSDAYLSSQQATLTLDVTPVLANSSAQPVAKRVFYDTN